MRFPSCGLAVLSALATFTSAQAKVLDSRATGFTIENSVTMAADADTTWNALVNHVDEW